MFAAVKSQQDCVLQDAESLLPQHQPQHENVVDYAELHLDGCRWQ